MLGLCCCTGFSPVETSWSNSLAPVHGLLIAVASLVVVHRLNSVEHGFIALRHMGSSCLPGSGIEPMSPAWQVDTLPLIHLRSPRLMMEPDELSTLGKVVQCLFPFIH